MTVFEPYRLLPRAITDVCRQKYLDWELLILQDGEVPGEEAVDEFKRESDTTRMTGFMPAHIVSATTPVLGAGHRIELISLPRAEGCFGNVGRHKAMEQSQGDYICWVNHDNQISPDFLRAHKENIYRTPGCISLVSIDYWKGSIYHGVFPRAGELIFRHVDMLCYALPLDVAKEVDAFGPDMEDSGAADWITLQRAMEIAPVERSLGIVGTHF